MSMLRKPKLRRERANLESFRLIVEHGEMALDWAEVDSALHAKIEVTLAALIAELLHMMYNI